MIIALILIPFIAGIVAFFLPNNVWRRIFLIAVAAMELCLTLVCWVIPPKPVKDIFALDALGLLMLTVTALLFFFITLYACKYLKDEEAKELLNAQTQPNSQGLKNLSEAIFSTCLLMFLSSVVLVAAAQHFGLLWVAIEATTLATAPLIYFHRHQRSLEATWKYLIICSVGIALALLGTFLLNVSWQTSPNRMVPLTFSAMIANSAGINELWFKIAFIFIFIGYGTKMGLAPMHTWLPDAHSEAPSLASALLSGAILNCAFLGLLRLYRISVAVGYQDFSSELFIIFGLLSMLVAAFFILGQTNFKRMLAYSSVEHMGILLLAVGLGGLAAYGGMIHLVCHSLTKAAMFLLAGNFLAFFGRQVMHKITGGYKVLPKTSALWIAGLLALAGCPPFGLFTSEFTILRGMLMDGFGLVPLIYLFCLGLVFIGMASTCIHMVYGPPMEGYVKKPESRLAVTPPLALLGLCLVVGLYQPLWLQNIFKAASQCITGI